MNFSSINNILVLAPHTDDGELGCGGSISRFRDEGINVHYAAFSLCERSLPAGMEPGTLATECRNATAELGIDSNSISFYDFDVRNFSKYRQEILEILIELKNRLSPDLIFLPCRDDVHQDHAVIHEEGLRAFKHSSVLGYELPWNHSTFNATLFISLENSNIERKNKALSMYQSQQHRNYMSAEFISSLARVRGVQSNVQFAEAFEVYRMMM